MAIVFTQPNRCLTIKLEHGVPRLADAQTGELIAGVKSLQITANPDEIMTGQTKILVEADVDVVFGTNRSNESPQT